jgi:hypothetical protein
MAHAREPRSRGFIEDSLNAIAIHPARRVHVDREKQPFGIDQNMPLAPRHLLVPVVAPESAHQRLHRLTVNNRGIRGGVASGMLPRLFTPLRMDLDPGAIQAKLPKIGLHRATRTVLAGEIAPGAVGVQQVE